MQCRSRESAPLQNLKVQGQDVATGKIIFRKTEVWKQKQGKTAFLSKVMREFFHVFVNYISWIKESPSRTIRVLALLEICSDSKQQMGQVKDSETSSRDLSKRSARRRCCSKFRRHACRLLGPHRACLQARETQKSSTPRPTWICLYIYNWFYCNYTCLIMPAPKNVFLCVCYCLFLVVCIFLPPPYYEYVPGPWWRILDLFDVTYKSATNWPANHSQKAPPATEERWQSWVLLSEI